MSEFGCLISDKRVCKPDFKKDLVFIIGSGSPEFTDDLNVIIEVLDGKGLKGDFALLNDEEKGFDAFCNKICSQILNSQFCIVMLNDPIALEYIDKATKEDRIFRAPRPNVYYEYGIAVARKKRIIPLIRGEMMPLPFDVQHLDAIVYNNEEDLKNQLRDTIDATLGKPIREDTIKSPELELALLDGEGNPANSIVVSPTFTVVKKEKTSSPFKATAQRPWFVNINPKLYGIREPSEDLVPIRISIANEGEVVANGVKIFLHFPKESELFSKHEVLDGLITSIARARPTYGGLSVDPANRTEARAWIDELGNDIIIDKFDEVYVKFRSEEYECKIKASVTQYNFPTKDFEFVVAVKPQIKEKIEYVYEKPAPEDFDIKVLEERIKDLGKEDEQKTK